MKVPKSLLTHDQKRVFRGEGMNEQGRPVVVIAKVRHDDECRNGHNTFSITGEVYGFGGSPFDGTVTHKGTGRVLSMSSCGCCHDDIAKYIPELRDYIKWHLVSTDGPMHMVANALYHAGDRDHRGLLKDEKRQLVNGRTKQPVWEVVVRDEAGGLAKLGSGHWVDAEQKPASQFTVEWEPVWIVGEGKKRELDHARSSAVWPEATDQELMQEPEALKAVLIARLPKLMQDFKAAVESLGFTY